MKTKDINYKHFMKYYIEIDEALDELVKKAMEFRYGKQEIPKSLKKEIERHNSLLNILTQFGKEQYNKSPETILEEGRILKK